MCTWAWKNNNYKWYDAKSFWRRSWYFNVMIALNHRSMQSWCSRVISSFGQCCTYSSTMPYKLSSLGSIISWVHTWDVDRHVMNSSFSGANDCSPLDMVHESLASTVVWKEWSVEACRLSSECVSWGFGSLINYGEVDRFLNDVKIFSSWEVEIKIPTIARTWAISLKLIVIFKSISLVDNPCFHTWISSRGSYSTPRMI